MYSILVGVDGGVAVMFASLSFNSSNNESLSLSESAPRFLTLYPSALKKYEFYSSEKNLYKFSKKLVSLNKNIL